MDDTLTGNSWLDAGLAVLAGLLAAAGYIWLDIRSKRGDRFR